MRIGSRPGEGTSVAVFLPRASHAPEQIPTVQIGEGKLGILPPLAGRRVLVVDDDADVRRVVVGMLREDGAVVGEVASGSEALETLKAAPNGSRPDVVLMDYAMPGMTGLETAHRLRDLVPDLPIVIMTGYADLNAMRSQGEVDAVVGKPFRAHELVRCLGTILGRVELKAGTKIVPLRRIS